MCFYLNLGEKKTIMTGALWHVEYAWSRLGVRPETPPPVEKATIVIIITRRTGRGAFLMYKVNNDPKILMPR